MFAREPQRGPVPLARASRFRWGRWFRCRSVWDDGATGPRPTGLAHDKARTRELRAVHQVLQAGCAEECHLMSWFCLKNEALQEALPNLWSRPVLHNVFKSYTVAEFKWFKFKMSYDVKKRSSLVHSSGAPVRTQVPGKRRKLSIPQRKK